MVQERASPADDPAALSCSGFTRRTMRIGVFNSGWWKAACEVSSLEAVDLPVAAHPSGNAYLADLAARNVSGKAANEILAGHTVDMLVDNGGEGLGFVQGAGGMDDLTLSHEMAGKRLFSHFIDPLVTALQGLDWSVVWQSLQSRTWVKAVWDRAQVVELQRFGVPNVIHLPMAAPDRVYDTRPLDPSKCRPIVSFVGGQNTSYFTTTAPVPPSKLLAGTLAQAVRGDLPNMNFCEIYHDAYGLGELPQERDDLQTRVKKTALYFSSKLFYNAGLCIRNRDRFVMFLARKLGDTFHLVGKGWDAVYGLATAPRLESSAAYFDHFREAAINLNLVNGNAETGLNMRHFEITAAGGFMMCYDQPEISEHFEVGKECVVFRNEVDLLEKTRYYLDHPEQRAAIALAGQKRTLSSHLYSHRLQSLVALATPRPLPVEYSRTKRRDELERFMPNPDVVLDCGANIGQTAKDYRDLYPHAEIYSFEPVKAVFEQLRVVCAELGVHAVQRAVGDRDGKAMINLTASPEANSLLGFQEGNPCAQWTRIVGREEVDVCTLDRWCEENDIDPKRVGVLKLDVQGAELQALYGARKLLETTKVVYLEVSFVLIYEDSPLFGEIDAFLTECGYRRHAVYPSDQPHNWGDALYVKN